MKELFFPFAIDDKGESVLEVLFDHHYESRSKDDPRVEAAYKSFCHTLLTLDPVLVDEVMGASAVLCMESERAGFIAGMKTCALLMRNLSE